MATTITISEALGWMDTLRKRHTELVQLRNQNSYSENVYRGANADKMTERTPVYDVKKLDAIIGNLAREERLLDAAIKKTNATATVVGYTQDDSVLGVIE